MSLFRHDLQQYDTAGERGYDTPFRYARGFAVGNSAPPRASEMPGKRKCGDERQAEPAAMGGRTPVSRNRDADLRCKLDLERRGQQ